MFPPNLACMCTMQDYQYGHYPFGGNYRLTSLFKKLNHSEHVPAFWIVNDCLERPLDHPLRNFKSKHFNASDVAQPKRIVKIVQPLMKLYSAAHTIQHNEFGLYYDHSKYRIINNGLKDLEPDRPEPDILLQNTKQYISLYTFYHNVY